MERNNDEKQIVRYLLGQLGEDEQRRVEERLISNDEYFELLLVAEDDLIDDYVKSKLPAGERERFEAYFLSTPERREKLGFARALLDYVSAESAAVQIKAASSPPRAAWWRQLASAQSLRLAAAAIVLVAAGLGAWRIFFYQSEVSKGMTALNNAFPAQRPVESRISSLDYRPFTTTRGGDQGQVDRLSLNRAERILFDEAEGHPSAASLHALGRLYLAEKKFDEATGVFEKALKLDDKDARLHSDLGAAWLERAKIDRSKGEDGKSFEGFARSLEHLSKALELNGSLLEALFNRALCQEYMLLYREAEKDWKSYLEKDPGSKWADEARQKLKETEERNQQSTQNREQLFQDFLDAYKAKDESRAWKIINQAREPTGGYIENRLIDDHLDLVAKGREGEARDRLDAFVYASEVAYRQAGDMFLPDLARFYKRATPAQRKGVSEARSLMNSGHDNYSKSNFDAALKSYNEAKEGFERAGNSCEAVYAACLIGNCYVQQSKAEQGLALLQPLAETYEKKSYRWSLARTLNVICTANQYLRDFSMAISNGNRSLALSEEIGDVIGAVRTRYLLAAAYRFVNDSEKALDLYVKDLSLARAYMPQPAQLWRHYASISLAFDQIGFDGAAVAFQQEALQLATEANAPRFICRSYSFLGFILAERGDYAEAAANIKRAIEIGNTLGEQRVRVEALAYSFLQLGYVYRNLGDFDKAIESYDQAIQSYGELDSKFFDYLARKERLLCCMEYDGCPSVEQEVETVLRLFEQHRTKILEESIRNTFFDAEQTIYDVAIEYEYFKKGDLKRAFEYSERSRGRSLRDLISKNVEIIDDHENPDMKHGEVSQPIGVEEIQARMPRQAQIVQYAVLKNHILIWVVTGDRLSSASQSIATGDLNKRVNRFLELIPSESEDDREALSREAAYLYNLLIKPVEQMLGGEQLCIVPDKILNYLPFGAL
ncbi:MAG TPA: tetratricopeptide repeat protein, partial [Blastocatellia bacterium]